MSKVKIEDLKVFPAIADVIGEAKAKVELFKLQGVDCDFEDKLNLDEAFYWSKAPQGYGFWRDVESGVNPHDK